MSTSAIFSFVSDITGEAFHVYKHWDGYPEGGFPAILAATGKAWKLNRFEPDEFGAAFIAANKTGEGDLRLLPCGRWQDIAPQRCEFHYTVIQFKSGHVHVYCDSVEPLGIKYGAIAWDEARIKDGGLKELAEQYDKQHAPVLIVPVLKSGGA